ncbi:hypothetical protein ABFS83_06G063100 [Erythranthe nasuta]
MKRRLIHQINHPFGPHPFETFRSDSWKPVERLKINNGGISAQILDNGELIEEDVATSDLRVRSRKATPSDCTSFLRPGVDFCLLVKSDNSDNKNVEVSIDAKIRSIKRKPHEAACDCEFYVSLYLEQGPDLIWSEKKLSKETSMVKIDRISILQKLEMKPCEGQYYYRWSFTEDCSTLQKFKLFCGRFCNDLSWLAVSSVLKKTAFDIRTINSRLCYEVSEYNPTEEGEKADPPSDHTHTVNFKMENDIFTPVIVKLALNTLPEGSSSAGLELGFLNSDEFMELRRSKRRNIQPERYLACDNLPDYEIEVTRLGENKTYKSEFDEVLSDSDASEEEMHMSLSVQADNDYMQFGSRTSGSNSSNKKMKKSKKSGVSDKGSKENGIAVVSKHTSSEKGSVSIDKSILNYKVVENDDQESGDIEQMVSKYFYMNNPPSSSKKKTSDLDFMDNGRKDDPRGSRRNYNRTGSHSGSSKRDCFYVRDSTYDVRSFRKGSVTAQLCRELIRRCMNNIEATLDNEPVQPPVVDHWKELQAKKDAIRNESAAEEKPTTVNGGEEGEVSEIDMLWKEMELALVSLYLQDDNEDSARVQQPNVEAQKSNKNEENKCAHDYILNEQVGTVCRLCGFVETEIKDILPPFVATTHSTANKDQRTEEDSEQNNAEDQEFGRFHVTSTPAPAPSTAFTQGENNVWALIPELKDKLLVHQKKAFEFLWRNIAGSLTPSRMEDKKKKRGGCVISHSPGAGKTLLIIAFLVSYLKLFPNSRPLVLAPKTTLYTWYKEIIKWKVPIPVYQIHGGQTYKGEVLKQRMKLSPGLPRNQDVMHVLDCLEKMQRWLSHPSILLMGYTSFLTLTREDSPYAHRKYMAKLLKNCPGILILDEGHNPRSTKSRLRKGLMKVNTRLRVLLSGTLFQNNFGEYFNTLCLARPVFVNEVLKKLDPKYEKRNKQRQTQFSLENRGRKLLIDKISKKIDSNIGQERSEALKTLRKLTSKFIDVYEGGASDGLPGLQCYTLMMKSTNLQQDILSKMQNRRLVYKGFPLELELLITLGAIHPWLITTTLCSGQYLTPEELTDLENFKFDLKCGSKVRFVMNLIPRCLLRNEKVLIFCHNIAPINLFIQIFERFYGWKKGREVLVLQGDIELFERGRVMDMFEEPGGPSKVMLASITACAEGISLTAASRVILLDSEWNPSKSKQAVARAFRPGQNKVVYVYQLLANGTLEEEKHSRTTWKEWVSDMIFSDEHVEDPSHWQAPKIEDELLREIVEEDRAALFHRIMKNEKASNNVVRGKGLLKKS